MMSFSHIIKAPLLSTLTILMAIWVPLTANAEESGTHIRTLASSCATCHGGQPTNETVIPSLAGLDEDYFINKMKDYRSSDKEHDVMVQHAKGLTETEIEQLATLFAKQVRACPYFRKHPIKKSLE